MQTKQITVYDYSELSDNAKANVEQWVHSDGFAWTEDSIDSVRAFCALFDVKIKDYELGLWGHSYIQTDAESATFRGFTLKQAQALPEYPTGYCLDETLRLEFIKEFKHTGNAKTAFDHAINEAVKDILSDWESQQTDEYLADHCEANGYQFDEYGHIA